MYSQVILYAVRGHYDHDIIEGSEVTIETNDGNIYHGKMGSVESEYVSIYDSDEEQEFCIDYSDIKSISD